PVSSTPTALHNYGPGSRAIQRPRCFRPALEPVKKGTGRARNGLHERRKHPGNGDGPAARLPWPPWTTAALWNVFPGWDEPKWAALQRIAVALGLPTLHNYGPSIRTKNNAMAGQSRNSTVGQRPGTLIPGRVTRRRSDPFQRDFVTLVRSVATGR